ncbi:hypothetical protein FKM82_014903 [Ascaphus truei]
MRERDEGARNSPSSSYIRSEVGSHRRQEEEEEGAWGLLTSRGLSPRQEKLAKPKSVSTKHKQDRTSAMWPVSAPALLAVLSPRMEQLAQARGLSREWREDRSVYSTVTEGAKLACATPRTMQLAKPKNHSTSSRPETHSNQSSRSEKSVGYTARTETLALPKTEHPLYQHDMPIQQQISTFTLHTKASDRVCQLATPKPRKAVFEGYNPYTISAAAKHAEASSRILELCVPPARKLLPKKH